MRVRLSSMIGALVATGALGCNLVADPGSVAEPTTTNKAAVTDVAAPRSGTRRSSVFRESDIKTGPQPGTPAAQPIPRRAIVPASEHPGHFREKVVDKTAAQTPTSAPPAVPAAYVAKQRDYLARWDELRRTITGLPQEEQDARRAELKRTVLGE